MNWDTNEIIELVKNSLGKDLISIEVECEQPSELCTNELYIDVKTDEDMPGFYLYGSNWNTEIFTPNHCECEELIFNDAGGDGTRISEVEDLKYVIAFKKIKDALKNKYGVSTSFERS